jgi:malonyl-CoA O-methyltransferase
MPRWVDRILRRPVTLDAAEAYELWAPLYPPRAHNHLMELEERAVLAMMPDIANSAVLDLACGSGRYLRILAQRGAAHVVGIDCSWAMLSQARAISSNLIQADMFALGLRPGSFHLAVCGLAIGHVKDLHRAMREISSVLTAGGTVIYSDFHPLGSWLGWQRTFRSQDGMEYAVKHHTHFYSDHVAACSAARLQIEQVGEPLIEFGEDWRGYPALLIIRARKVA